MNWEIEDAAVNAKARIQLLLGDGWEPFSVDGGRIYFRRKAVGVRRA